MSSPGDDKPLSAAQAFDAMRAFLDAYWKRGAAQGEELATLLGALEPQQYGMPLDSAQWGDWLAAIEQVR